MFGQSLLQKAGGSSAALALAALAGLSACTQVAYPPPSDEVRARLGAITIVTAPSQRAVAPDAPVKGKGAGALSGAGQGAAGSLFVGASVCQSGEPIICAFGLTLGIAAAPVAALVGAGVGAGKAHAEEEVSAAAASLDGALDDATLPEMLAERVGAVAARQTAIALVPWHPTDHDLDLPGVTDLAARGADTLLQLEVTRFELVKAGHIDPDLTLLLGVRARLLAAADGTQLYMRGWAYRGRPYNYFDMAAEDARTLRAELRGAVDRLAERIVQDLFVTKAPEVRRTHGGPVDTVWTTETWPAPTAYEAGQPNAAAAVEVEPASGPGVSQDPVAAPVGPAPPRRAGDQVRVYLERNQQAFARQLARYNERHKVLVNSNGSAKVARIYSQEIERLDGESVFLEVRFQVGAGQHPQSYAVGCAVFELKWIDTDLEFVGHRAGCA